MVDGLSELHRARWVKGKTYSAILETHVLDMQQRYPTDKTMCIFDGYASSTKDAAYFQRDKSCPEIVFDLETTCETNRNVFLSNSKNNTPLISFCEGYL